MSDNEPDTFKEGMEKIRKAFIEVEDDLDKLAETCDYEMKIAVTQWVMRHIVEHAKDGGTYRYLIYDRLGFEADAYVPLCRDGLTISNEFDLNLKESLREVAKTEGYDKIKPVIGLCDEPGCYDYISCGWPSDDGYRSTCSEHMKKLEN
jgi:hypothetical protein